MQCGRCGADNPGKRFCGDCGAPLQAVCPGCGADVEPDKRFCGDCGTALTPATPADGPDTPAGGAGVALTSTAEPVAERRLCSMLFVDLVGFTTVSEGRDPEDVRELLSGYFDVANTVVGRYGGTIEKFIGDAVMAVWGTPVATEQDAERAVRAALDLVDAVHQLGMQRNVVGLAARAGVYTGDVAVTIGATNEGMVAGDAVNTAARIQSAAAAGTVFVDATTRRLTANAISYHDEGVHALKGREQPEQLWRALRVVSSVGGVQRVDGLEAPLTGRGAEIRAIREMFHAAAERRQARLLLISGVAGVGKSRLGWEFEKYVDGLADVMLWHRGRCLSYGDGLVYWALTEIVRQRFGIAEEDTPEVAAERLAAGLAEWLPDPADRAFVGPRLGRLLGVPVAGDAGTAFRRTELFAGWRRLFERMAEVEPVMILIEDAHHAAPDLLDFLDHLIDWARDLPIFVLVFARPELETRRPGFGSGRNRATIALEPLDQAATDAIVNNLVPGMPATIRQAITDRAQGIPLYAIESIRALIDRDVIQPVDGSYRLVGELGDGALAVPESLHALLAARLDALDPVARRVVTDAAVLGTSFPAEAVTAVSGLDSDTTAAVLAELLRREVLEVSADRFSPERGNYRFAQEMLRQVAYDTLSRRDRKVRHLAVAAHLRNTFPGDGEEVVDVVARHYADALEAVPDDADTDDIRTRLIDTLIRAAERATRSGSPQRALVNYGQAGELVEAAGDPLRAAELWLLAAAPGRLSGDFARIIDLTARARQVFVDHGDSQRAARALTEHARSMSSSGRLSDARTLLLQALDEIGPDASRDRLETLVVLSSNLLINGVRGAEGYANEALHLAHTLAADDATYSHVLSNRGLLHDTAGDRRLAAMFLHEGARLAELSGESATLIMALGNLTNVLNVDRPAEAIEPNERAQALAAQIGDRTTGGLLLTNLAYSYLAVGDWDAAERTLARGDHADLFTDHTYLAVTAALFSALRGDAETARALTTAGAAQLDSEDPQDRAGLATAQAFAAYAVGDSERALAYARDSLTDLGRESWLSFAGDDGRWAWPLAARVAHDLGRYDDEAALLALTEAEQRGTLARLQLAEAELIRARLADARGEPEVAALYTQAVAALRSDSTPYHLAHGLLDQADFLQRAGDADAASALITEADEIAGRLRCAPLAARAARSEATAAPT